MSWFKKKDRTDRILDCTGKIQSTLARKVLRLPGFSSRDINKEEFFYFCYYLAFTGSAMGGGKIGLADQNEMEQAVIVTAISEAYRPRHSATEPHRFPEFQSEADLANTLKEFKSRLDSRYYEYYEATKHRSGYQPLEELTASFVQRCLSDSAVGGQRQALTNLLRSEVENCLRLAMKIR